jgi:hypothetical protein
MNMFQHTDLCGAKGISVLLLLLVVGVVVVVVVVVVVAAAAAAAVVVAAAALLMQFGLTSLASSQLEAEVTRP